MNNQPTIDTLQIKEWEESIDNVIDYNGVDTARFIINRIADRVRETTGERVLNETTTDYINTISVEKEHVYPGDKILETKLQAMIRWNATAMVLKANKVSSELGGHIASYASASSYTKRNTAPTSDSGSRISLRTHWSIG